MSRAAQSVVVVLILAAVGVGAWWALGRDAAAAPPAQASPDVEAKVDEVAASPPMTEASPARVAREALEAPPAEQPVEGAPEATEPFDDSAAKVDPWMLRFEVVDEARQPVANAKVTIWEGRRADPRPLRSMGIEGNSYSGHHPEPLFELVTDTLGYTEVKLDIECLFASAEKQGVGSAPVRSLWSSRNGEEPVRLQLERRIELRGIVLGGDGAPAAGAIVKTASVGISTVHGWPAKFEPVVADAEGRFAVAPVTDGSSYSLVAEVGDERTFAEEVWVRDGAAPHVTLRVPGAITIGGVVVDERGEPVPGAVVRSWREVGVDADGRPTEASETERREADADGRFRIAVRRLARYQLVASHDGLAQSAPLWFEPNEARPHVEARLVLRRLATIAGRVVRAGGDGFEGVRVVATADSGSRHRSAVGPGREELYGRPASAEADADGRFELAVHPDTTWRLAARFAPDNYRLSVELPGVQPGRTDALIRISDAQLAGCVVRGVIVVEGDEPLSGYEVDIVNYEYGEPASGSGARGEFGEREFTLQPLPLARMFALRVSQKVGEGHFATNNGPYAPAVYGPFTPDRAEMSIEVALKRWGELPVRVLRADGAPTAGMRVIAAPVVYMSFYPSVRPAGDDGTIVLKRLVPGEADLRVFDGASKVHEQRLRIEPGRNAEIVVRLAAASSAVDSGR